MQLRRGHKLCVKKSLFARLFPKELAQASEVTRPFGAPPMGKVAENARMTDRILSGPYSMTVDMSVKSVCSTYATLVHAREYTTISKCMTPVDSCAPSIFIIVSCALTVILNHLIQGVSMAHQGLYCRFYQPASPVGAHG